MHQRIHNTITFFIRDVKANLSSRSHFISRNWPDSTAQKMSEFPQW
jgi:hypothetical protein